MLLPLLQCMYAHLPLRLVISALVSSSLTLSGLALAQSGNPKRNCRIFSMRPLHWHPSRQLLLPWKVIKLPSGATAAIRSGPYEHQVRCREIRVGPGRHCHQSRTEESVSPLQNGS